MRDKILKENEEFIRQLDLKMKELDNGLERVSKALREEVSNDQRNSERS